jgi:chemotaxis signal transduction protein
MSLNNTNTDTQRALTFTIDQSSFGIDVSHILSFSDSFGDIKYSTNDAEGFIGYLDFRNTLVQVFECATALSQTRERESVIKLVADIKTYQQAHIDWVGALEHSITSSEPFTKPRDPRLCAFGQWFYAFETDDDGLRALLNKIEDPHKHIHSLADKLLDMSAAGDQAQAIEELRIEKQTTLKKLLRVLDYINDYLNNSIHPIVIHLTKDGRTPWFSLVLDTMGDIAEYSSLSLDDMQSVNQNEPIKGYVRDPSGNSFMLLSLDKLYDQVNSKFSIAG